MADSVAGTSNESIALPFGGEYKTPALPSTAPYEHYIHEIVYRLGRKFDFQAYNVIPETRAQSAEEWVPGTIFVASDHLTQVLAKNIFTRHPGSGDARERFIMSIWELHSKIFHGYEGWRDHVGVPSRPQPQNDTLAKSEPYTDSVGYMFLNEIALYLCIWTESANLRYMPELLWFVYHIMRFSPMFEELLQQEGKGNVVPTDPDQDVSNLRQLREELRHKHWIPIAKMRGMEEEPTEDIVARHIGTSRDDLDLAPLVLEIVINGDGGQYLERVVQPLFHFLAHQMDHLGGKLGMESINRINYDDCNECMANKSLVHRTLRKLGVESSKIKNVHGAYEALTALSTDAEGEYDMEKAVDWWTHTSFTKTYRERRSYLQIFRMFWRMFAYHALFFHLGLIIAFYGFKDFDITSCTLKLVTESGDSGEEEETTEEKEQCESVNGLLAAYSSVVLTHAFLTAIERFVAGYLSRSVNDPQAKRDRKVRRKKKYIDLEAPDEEEQLNKKNKKQKKRKKPSVRIEGAPFGVYLEGLIWLGIFLALLAIFIFQFMKPDVDQLKGLSKDNFKRYWFALSIMYTILVLLHAVLSTRDGYMISLTSYLSFGILSRYFRLLRGRPMNEVPASLKVSIRVFLWNLFFWVITLTFKAVFDYFFIISPLADALASLSNRGWLNKVLPNDTEIPGTSVTLPDDFDFLLMIIRAVPSFLIVLVDSSVFYMLTAVVFGMMRGLVLLNLGVVGNFQEVQNEFRKCPKQWWQKCISREGHINIRDQLSHQRSVLSLGDMNRQPEGEEDGKSKKKNKTKKAPKKSRKENQVPAPGGEEMYEVFSDTWNQIIDDLRDADLISNSERENLKYMKLEWHESLHEHKLKPLLAPVFVFAGQMQKAVEVPRPSTAHLAIAEDFRDLLLWMLHTFDMIDKPTCEKMKNVFLLHEPFDRHHRIARRKILGAIQDFLSALNDTSKESARDETAWVGACARVRSTIEVILQGLWYELDALRDHKKARRLNGKNKKQNIENLEQFIKSMKKDILQEEGKLERCLWPLSKDGPPQQPHDSDDEEESRPKPSHDLLTKIIAGVIKRLTTTRVVATPSGREARQFLTFFVTSMFNPQLQTPPPLVNMMSWTTLVPVYQEDVVYAIRADETARRVGGPTPEPGVPSGLTDLLTETDTRVSLLSYLRSVFPKDWHNFLERLKEKHNIDIPTNTLDLTGEEFMEDGYLYEHQTDLLIWASNRGQLLSRTVKGMMVYEKALKLIALLEHPRPEGMSDEDYNLAIEELVTAKFRCVVAAQVYGSNKRGKTLKQKWDATAVEMMLTRYPTLRVSYLDFEKQRDRTIQYAVLIRGMSAVQAKELAPGKRPVEEIYRIRLPINYFTGRGVIIGEGKPENQNHAVPFAFGENLQTIDMNQDNFLLEALKMRNLLNELRTPEYLPKRSKKKNAKEWITKMVRRLDRFQLKKPILIGFREWIFSDKAGALGSFAAGTEFAFGTILQRVMTFPGRARFHYGHPDVWDKLWVMTRGGISKASRNLHVSEDVFGGFNAGLRGGKIAYRDYLSVGKGRDMGFVSINGFEIKISGGNGEVCLSRELYRLATRTDFFRMMSIYYSGPGFFINNAILMTTVYLQTWLLAVLALAGAYLIETGEQEVTGVLVDSPPPAPPPPAGGNRRLMEADADIAEVVWGRSLLQYGYDAGTADDVYSTPYSNFEDTQPVPEEAAPSLPDDAGGLEYYITYGDPGDSGVGGGVVPAAPAAVGAPQAAAAPAPPRNVEIPESVSARTPAHNFGWNGSQGYLAGHAYSCSLSTFLGGLVDSQSVACVEVLTYVLCTQIAELNTTNILRNVDTAVEITSIVQLGMLTVIAYVGELLLELGVLQTAGLILIQVLSGSLAFFIFKQQTDAAAFVEDMSYGGARYVGTGREFALMHNPFVMLYARYGRTHFYFAMKLILLCIMLLLLEVPGYGSATFGSWMVALSLIFAPFWFNPVQFVMAQTKADYKQWVRWMQGEEVDPDSKTTWFTWHDKSMAKIRNENSNITDHWQNALRNILWELLLSGPLAVAAISQIRVNKDVGLITDLEKKIKRWESDLARSQLSLEQADKLRIELKKFQAQLDQAKDDDLGLAASNSPEKFLTWALVTVPITLVGLLCFWIFLKTKKKGHVKFSRVVRVLSGVAFIIASIILANYPDFLETNNGENGWRNLLLIYYANYNLISILIQVMMHCFHDHVSVRHAVDKVYHIVDYLIGIFLFMILFVLSFTRFFAIIQNTLLYSVSVARSIQNKELVETIGIERVGKAREDNDDDGEHKASLGDRLQQLIHPDREGSFTGSREGGSSMLSVQREGSFTRGDSFTKMKRKLSGELSPTSMSKAHSLPSPDQSF